MSYLLKTGMIPTVRGHNLNSNQFKDKETASLIRLFLITALREAWEEIGLNPFNVIFLGFFDHYFLTLQQVQILIALILGTVFSYSHA